MINASDIPNGAHFWAKIHDNELVMIEKQKEGYYMCGPWECDIRDTDFEILEVIKFPDGLTAENLYYK